MSSVRSLVLILVIAIIGVQSGTCPGMCSCGRHPNTGPDPGIYNTKVTCDGYPGNITAQLDDTTVSITLKHLAEGELEALLADLAEEETRLVHLTQLTITESVIIADQLVWSFSNISLIRSINLSSNNITELIQVSINASSLLDLDLSNNSLIKIENKPFRTLPTLETLNLSVNSLSELNTDMFSGLLNLKCLDLTNNNLTTLPDRLFAAVSTLQYLNLSNNNLQALNEDCFSNLTKLQQLDVSWNKLVRAQLQLPSLARLILTGNSNLGVAREPILLVGTGQRLHTVDASRIGLKQVPAALTHSIRTLRLGGNGIKTVRCGDLDSYPLLQLLDFNSNSLEMIEDDALGRLDSLTILYLTSNEMKEIPKSLSEKLKVLHLEFNNIEKVGGRDLLGLAALEVLLLNDNKIRVVEEEAFSQLSALVTLDLSRNPIKTLEAGCLSGPLTLQVLRLSSINVISPAKELSFPLSSTEHLITLDLSGSPGLSRQLLVDTAALVASRELQELDLSNTELETIRSDLLHFLPQLRIFHIRGNRINCTDLQWLGKWMRRQDLGEYKKITCSSPPELWGTLLIDLQDGEISSNYLPTTQRPEEQNKYGATNSGDGRNQPRGFNEVKTREIFNGITIEALQDWHDLKINTKNLTLDSNTTEDSSTNLSTTDTSNANSIHRWNVSTGEMSMFSAGENKGGNTTLHPGLLILAAGILGAAAALALLAARLTSRRSSKSNRRVRIDEEELEVGNLPGVTELW